MIDFYHGMLTIDIPYDDLPADIKSHWHPTAVKKAFAWYQDKPEIVVIPKDPLVLCYGYRRAKDVILANLPADIDPDKWCVRGWYGADTPWRND